MENKDYVTIDLSKKQVDYDSARVNEKNGKEYVRVFAPGGGVFFYPLASLKENKDNENRVHFTRPTGTELTISYSERNPNVPDDAPASEKYTNTSKVVKIEDLREMYQEERKFFAERQKEERENSPFVNVSVPTEWGREFVRKADENHPEEQKFVSISVPIKEGDKSQYYSFVIPAESFKASTKEEGQSYFGFPRKKMDSEENYIVTLKRSEKQPDGTYQNISKEISSEDLIAAIKRAKEIRHENVDIEVSERLIRSFQSGDGKNLISVAVPVFDNQQGKDVFYNIVLPESRMKDTEKEGRKMISLSADVTYNAKHGVLDESINDYVNIEKKLTGADIKKAFEDSKERFAEQAAEESINQEKNEQAKNEQQNVENNVRPQNRRGR